MTRLLILALLLLGAKAPDTSCAISNDVLTITGLPTRDTFAVTNNEWPVGTMLFAPDGTYTVAWPYSGAWVWQRGGGPSLVKMPKQLGDYHLIATCAA